MSIFFRPHSFVWVKNENIKVAMPSFDEVKITPLSRHIAYKNDAAEEPRNYKKSSSKKINGLLASMKLSKPPVEHY